MLEIDHVVVGTRNQTGDDPRDRGDSEEGFYTVEGDLLTMVNVDGVPLRNAAGEKSPRASLTAPRRARLLRDSCWRAGEMSGTATTRSDLAGRFITRARAGREALGDDPRNVAGRLKRREWLKENGSDFNRPAELWAVGVGVTEMRS